MATRANLIATYNANPTLQSQYTLDQYLALFDFGQTTTPTPDPDPTPTPTPEVPGIPNIINQNLNQGGGGGGDGPPPGPTFNRNDLLGTSDYQGTGPGFFESIIGIPAALIEGYTKISPGINFMKNIFSNKKKEFTKNSAQMVREEIAKQEAAAEAAALANAQRTGRRPTAFRGSGIQDSQSLGNPSAGQTGGYSYDSGGRQGFGYGLADGGRVYLYNRLK